MGKHKPDYTPFLKTGDHVVVINAEKVRLTGNKEDQKIYYRHSGYPGGIQGTTARDLRAKFPERLLENAVIGMLPKNKLGKQLVTRLKVYAGPKHPHEAQQPETVPL
jgi:large subunit ribosomal protein L13